MEIALFHCEAMLGGSWYYAPRRWGTSDGCVPVRVVWAYFYALPMARARVSIDTARGIGLAFGSEESGQRAWANAFAELFPEPLPAPAIEPREGVTDGG